MNDEAVPREGYSAPLSDQPTSAVIPPLLASAPVQSRWMRRGYLIAAAVVILAAIALMIAMRGGGAPPPLTAEQAAPLISAAAPGKTAFTVKASFTGAIVARYDMPIGVEGEGGRVSAVLVEPGDRVRRGQPLARLDTSVAAPQVASLRAAVEQNRAEAALAQGEYRRAATVNETVGALSKEEVDRRRSVVATSAARLTSAEAQLAEAQARLGRTEIRAPEDGMVLTRTAEVGQTALAGGVLFRLARGAEVEMRAQIAEQDLPRLKVGQLAQIRLTGVATPFTGTVRLLAAVIDPQTRLGEIRIALPHDPNLRPGAFARGEVNVSSEDRPIVPQTALLSDPTGPYVLVVGPDNRVLRRAVRLGGTQPSGIVIADGLDGTERVVTTAAAFLRPGELVRTSVGK